MFDNHDAATKGTLLVDRLVPEDEVTFRILAAAVKDAAPLGLDDGVPLPHLDRVIPVFDDGLGIAAFQEMEQAGNLPKRPDL